MTKSYPYPYTGGMIPHDHPMIASETKDLRDYMKAHPEARDWRKHVTQEEIDKMEAEMLK
jgi:hypothetical protein